MIFVNMEIPEDITNFIESASSKNTAEKTESDIRRIREYLRKENETRPIEVIPSNELDLLLSRFFMNAKTRQGKEYEPSSLKGFQTSVARYLKSKGSSDR